MKCSYFTATLLVVGSLLGCSGDSSGPGAGGASGQVTDPSGDTFGAGTVQWDLTAMTITRDTGGITVLLDFSVNAISPVTGDTNAMIGFVDLDVDQDSTTGFTSTVDLFRPNPGSTGMGADYEIELLGYAADSTVTVSDSMGDPVGQVKPAFNAKRVTIRVPKALLGGDDGFLNASAIVGTDAEPTDIIPESGHLKLGGTGPVAPNRPGVSALRVGPRRSRVWGAGR